MVKRILAIALLALFMLVGSTGCYYGKKGQVASNEMGIRFKDGASISEVVGPGRYKDMGYYAAIKKIDISSKMSTWEDKEVWTKDKQPVKFKVTITYARMSDTESITALYTKYNAQAVDDESLAKLVLSRVPDAVKQTTTSMTLDEMLGLTGGNTNSGSDAGREKVKSMLSGLLKAQLAECYVELLDVTIDDISPDESYTKLLVEKANAEAGVAVAKSKTTQLQEQLVQEKAQTDIELEKARRQNEVEAEKGRVYAQNPQVYELKRLEAMQKIFGDKDKFYFIQPGTDLSMILGGNGQVINP